MGQTATKNYYDLLGVLPSASMTELKRSFREKAKSYHPDLNPDEEAQETFRDIQEAYHTLRDPVERTFYDRGLGIKSNWVDEAQRDSERKRADRVGSNARKAADRAEAQTGASNGPGRTTSGRTRRQTSSADGPSSRDTKAKASQNGSKNTSTKTPPAGESAKADEAGKKSKRGGATAGRTQDARSRRTRRSSRFAPGGAARTSEGSRPSEAYPPPPQAKVAWYKDKPLRIFLFATNILATLIMFFTDPTRGVYFLMLGFGIEILYRLDEIKGQNLRPPPFRPPPKP